VIQRVRHIVFCTVVMQCRGSGECRQLEREMGVRGFQPRGSTHVRGRSCVCRFVSEHDQGNVEQLRDAACEHLQLAAGNQPGHWRAYVQVCGNDGAWATLAPGKPPRLGSVEQGQQADKPPFSSFP
jgi:hypothetical protein